MDLEESTFLAMYSKRKYCSRRTGVKIGPNKCTQLEGYGIQVSEIFVLASNLLPGVGGSGPQTFRVKKHIEQVRPALGDKAGPWSERQANNKPFR